MIVVRILSPISSKEIPTVIHFLVYIQMFSEKLPNLFHMIKKNYQWLANLFFFKSINNCLRLLWFQISIGICGEYIFKFILRLFSTFQQQEIGRKGSNIYITNEQWRTAKDGKSYTAMGKSLLLSLFPMEVLLKSNLRGGHSKIRGVEERTAHSALNPHIIDALYCKQTCVVTSQQGFSFRCNLRTESRSDTLVIEKSH